MAEDDLTTCVAPFLDPHLASLLCIGERDNEKDLLQGKLDLLSDTDMVGFVMDICKNLYSDDIPCALREKKNPQLLHN